MAVEDIIRSVSNGDVANMVVMAVATVPVLSHPDAPA
jgi:hypothetical protein